MRKDGLGPADVALGVSLGLGRQAPSPQRPDVLAWTFTDLELHRIRAEIVARRTRRMLARRRRLVGGHDPDPESVERKVREWADVLVAEGRFSGDRERCLAHAREAYGLQDYAFAAEKASDVERLLREQDRWSLSPAWRQSYVAELATHHDRSATDPNPGGCVQVGQRAQSRGRGA